MAGRWSKNGGPAEALPFVDRDSQGRAYSNLAANPGGREACGWAPAGVPEEVTMAQARLALLQAGLLAEVDAWVETQDEATKIFWASSYRVRRSASQLVTAAAAKGWSDDFLDQLFFAAAAIP